MFYYIGNVLYSVALLSLLITKIKALANDGTEALQFGLTKKMEEKNSQ